METSAVIGTLAALCSVTSFTPQAWKIIKSRHTADISAGTYVLTCTGFALWTAYGFYIGAWPVIITNAICLILAGFILTMKLLPQRKKENWLTCSTQRSRATNKRLWAMADLSSEK